MAEGSQGRNWGRIALVTCPLVLLAGWASGWFSGSGYGNAWFDGLQKPFFMPPGWIFGVVWPILYALLGISLALVVAEPPSERRRFALALFFGQLALNFLWSPIFFGAHDIALAKWVIFAIAIVAAAAAGQFLRLRKGAGLLMIPYLIWLIFAATLNITIEALNPAAGASLLG
jgi:tryptophan-rich sensory protein